MKGPGLRIDLDVRRVWQCPKCGRQLHCDGDVTSRVCFCQKEETFMLLVGETKPAAPRPDCRENPPPRADPVPQESEILSQQTVSESDFVSGLPAASPALPNDAPGNLSNSETAGGAQPG